MSTIDPSQASPQIAGVLAGLEATGAALAPVVAASNPQAAAVLAAMPIAQAALTQAMNALQANTATSADVGTTAKNIAAALEATHAAWAAFAPPAPAPAA